MNNSHIKVTYRIVREDDEDILTPEETVRRGEWRDKWVALRQLAVDQHMNVPEAATTQIATKVKEFLAGLPSLSPQDHRHFKFGIDYEGNGAPGFMGAARSCAELLMFGFTEHLPAGDSRSHLLHLFDQKREDVTTHLWNNHFKKLSIEWNSRDLHLLREGFKRPEIPEFQRTDFAAALWHGQLAGLIGYLLREHLNRHKTLSAEPGTIHAAELGDYTRSPDDVIGDRHQPADAKPKVDVLSKKEMRRLITEYQAAWLAKEGKKRFYPEIAHKANRKWNNRSPIDKWLRGEGSLANDKMIKAELANLPPV